jgi:hypothetical protein
MDVLTPKGIATRKQEIDAVNLFLRNFPGFDYIDTPKDTPAYLDGFVVRGTTILYGVEVKCRMMTSEDLREKFENRWLVTADKIDRCVNICNELGIGFRGFLYLVPEKMLLIVPIWDYGKGYIVDIEYEATETQATVNGGVAVRQNAYIDVSAAKVMIEA